MKNLIILFSLLIFMGCGSRKADLQRQINIYKSELQNEKKKNTETDATIEQLQTSLSTLNESFSFTREFFLQQVSELSQIIEKTAAENKEDFSISNAVGNVKITDSKGNHYEIPSGTGTTISKNSYDRLQQDNSELKQNLRSELKGNEMLQQDLRQAESRENNYRSVIKEKNEEISTLNRKISNYEKAKDKKVDRKGISFGDFFWIIPVIILVWEVLKFFGKKAWSTYGAGFLTRLNLRR